jgi:D-alanine-D-alanine ligase
MTQPRHKIRVAVIYGGRSGEHEISLQSAASVIRNLDRERFEVIPIAIDKKGRWLLNDLSTLEGSGKSLPVFESAPKVVLPPNPIASGGGGLVPLSPLENPGATRSIDVVFPVMHGALCEDGSIQGLLELADLPYVGSSVLGSALGMDKDVAKRLVREAGLPVVPWIALKKESWAKNRSATASQVASKLGYPCFVKPANTGSSVGVHKVKEPASLSAAIADAFQYDTKILIEKAIAAREIEVAILENPDPSLAPLASIAGEIIPTHEFYSYESKYLDENGAALKIPAELGHKQMEEVRALAQKVFGVLELEGMARVDFFVDKVTGELFFNEVNTIPGFTSISMYPKMWEATGVPYKELLSRLIALAIGRHARKSALVREFHGG